jgi:hypothetical protein
MGEYFGLKEEVEGKWWQWRDFCLHSLYSSRGVIRVSKALRMRWAVHLGCPCMMGNNIMGGKPKEPRNRWLDNIKVELNDIRCERVVWIN